MSARPNMAEDHRGAGQANLAVDPKAAIDFLRALFAGTRDKIELRAFPSKSIHFACSPSKAAGFVVNHLYENLYFGVATREGGGKKQHCREITAVWVDLDFKDIPEEEAHKRVRSFPLLPSIELKSGGGLHLYWLLARSVHACDPRVEPILRGLTQALGGDRSAAEIARIMRLPGSVNWKYDPPRPCRVLEAEWARRYTLADFEQFRDDSRGHANFNSDGAGKIREGHRNSFLMSLAGSLRHRQLNETTIAVALLAVNRERCEPPLAEDEVLSIVKNASKYPAGGLLERGKPLARMECFASIVPKPLRWLWRDRIPAGKVSLLAGNPDQGKSLITVDIAARITTGTPFPDGAPCTLGSVIMLSAEDDPEDTIRPRLEAAGADVSRAHCLRGVRVALRDGSQSERGFSLDVDIAALEDAVRQVPDVCLIVIDPASAYLGSIDSHKNAEVRGLLALLAELVARTGVALLAVTHLRKAEGTAIHRVVESLAFAAAARAVWGVAQDPQSDGRRLMVRIKGNLSADPGGLAYRIEAENGIPQIVWEPGRVDVPADDIISGFESREGRSRQRDAQERFVIEAATKALLDEIVQRGTANLPVMLKDPAVKFLTVRGLKRSLARKVVNQPNPPWELKPLTDQRGHAVALIPRDNGDSGGGNTTVAEGLKIEGKKDTDFRQAHEQRAAEIEPSQHRVNSGSESPAISAADSKYSPPPAPENELSFPDDDEVAI
jgi:hypothetical protein